MQAPFVLVVLAVGLVFTGLTVCSVALSQVSPTKLGITISYYPEYNSSYACSVCPCENFTAELRSATVAGTIVWDPKVSPATNYKVALYILMPDKKWWAKPTFEERYVPVDPTGRWESTIFTDCFDPLAMRIAAFVLPADADPDRTNAPRSCPCSSGRDLVLDIGCLPPAIAGFPSTVVKRGFPEPYFEFSGHTFTKKLCPTACGPGNHEYSLDNVVLTNEGVELSIRQTNGVWRSAEVHTVEALGFGTYLVQITGPFVPMDLYSTLGIFLYDDCSPDIKAVTNREMDIEFSHWSQPGDPGAQFVIQPYLSEGHTYRFALNRSGTQTLTLVMDWNPARVRFACILEPRTLADLASTPRNQIEETWTFTNKSAIPTQGFSKFHVNVWVQEGVSPQSPSPITFTMHTFEFSKSNNLLWAF
eukprot:m.244420 g.244420  ORF g.244420 m.244420 type:complete len:418 (-) comp30910_c0_seq1:63-1316(-)